MSRLFIGFKIEDKEGRHLISLIKASNQPLPDTVRWTFDGNFHITAHFMPRCDEKHIPKLSNAMRIALANKLDRRILIEKIDLFPQHGSTLCAAWVTPSAFIMSVYATLKTQLEALCLPIELQPYRPHITLARGFAKNSGFTAISTKYSIKLNALILYESRLKKGGSRYTPIATIPIV